MNAGEVSCCIVTDLNKVLCIIIYALHVLYCRKVKKKEDLGHYFIRVSVS